MPLKLLQSSFSTVDTCNIKNQYEVIIAEQRLRYTGKSSLRHYCGCLQINELHQTVANLILERDRLEKTSRVQSQSMVALQNLNER